MVLTNRIIKKNYLFTCLLVDFIFSPHPVDLSQTEISTGMVYEDTRSKGTETPARWQVPQD